MAAYRVFNMGGLGLFLIGMGMMSARLKEVAGRKLKTVLESMTRRPLMGFAMQAALASENKLNRMQVEFRRNHVCRMTDGACDAQAGLLFIDFVDNLEKTGDHLTNVAQSVIGGLQWDGTDGSGLSGEYKALGGDNSTINSCRAETGPIHRRWLLISSGGVLFAESLKNALAINGWQV